MKAKIELKEYDSKFDLDNSVAVNDEYDKNEIKNLQRYTILEIFNDSCPIL